MKLKAFAASTAIVLSLTAFSSFAMPEITPKGEENRIQQHENHKKGERDPVKRLERKKEKIRNLLKEGKMTKDQADALIKMLDNRIAEIKEFQKLPLEKKREKVINDFRSHLDNLVRDGKLKQEEADRMMSQIIEKINNWDGTGYPKIHEKE